MISFNEDSTSAATTKTNAEVHACIVGEAEEICDEMGGRINAFIRRNATTCMYSIRMEWDDTNDEWYE